jgi:FkbM family methyltransferase
MGRNVRFSDQVKAITKAFAPPILLSVARIATNAVKQRQYRGMQKIECLGLKWRLDMDSAISRSIARTGVWEPETTRLILDCIKPGMRVLAVGANLGYFTLLMAQKVSPTGHVWAFEPTKKFRDQLAWHVQVNGFANLVTIVPFGLSDRADKVEIELMEQSASLHFPPDLPRIGVETINLKPLDLVAAELGIERVDFIQMDIDGHEAAFLRGARGLLSAQLPPIVMEFAQSCLYFAGSDVREVRALLNELGYEIWSEKTRRLYETEYEFLLECGNFNQYKNAIAVKHGSVAIC